MMKHFGKLTLVAALAMALVLGVAAFAENAVPEIPELPATEATAPDAAPEQSANDADDEALKAALDAYNAARNAARQESLEAELKSYVEAGKLTQEQADLILEYFSNREARHDDMGRGGKGGRMNGGMNEKGMNGRGGRFGQQQMPGQGMGPKGMAFTDGGQTTPDNYTDDAI